jgi:tetratricopeptide (TPR) repeat protein
MIEEAVQEYRSAIKHNPDLIAAHAELGKLLMTLGHCNQAMTHLKIAVVRMDNPQIKAACLALLKQAKEKIETQENDSPHLMANNVATGVSTPSSGLNDEATHREGKASLPLVQEQSMASLLPPSRTMDFPAPEGLNAKIEAVPWERFVDLYRTKVDATTDSPERARMLIKAARITQEKLNRPLEAILLYEEALAIAPNDLEAVEALADAAYCNQEWHRARELYDRLWEQGSTLPRVELCYRRALVYETLGDDITAEACYAEAIKADPTCRPALEGRARVALWHDNVLTAIEALSGLVKLISVDDPDTLCATREKLGDLYLRAGNLQQAKEFLEECLDTDPQQSKVMQTLITVYQRLGEYESMVQMIDQLVQATCNSLSRASLLHYQAEILGGMLGKEAAAIDCLLKAYDLAPSYPPVLWRLIDYYWERNEMESVAEMGSNLLESINLMKETPDLRFVHLAAAMLIVRNDASTAALLLRVALGSPELVEAAVTELGGLVAEGIASCSKLAEMILTADPQGMVFQCATKILEKNPTAQGLGTLLSHITPETPPIPSPP